MRRSGRAVAEAGGQKGKARARQATAGARAAGGGPNRSLTAPLATVPRRRAAKLGPSVTHQQICVLQPEEDFAGLTPPPGEEEGVCPTHRVPCTPSSHHPVPSTWSCQIKKREGPQLLPGPPGPSKTRRN